MGITPGQFDQMEARLAKNRGRRGASGGQGAVLPAPETTDRPTPAESPRKSPAKRLRQSDKPLLNGLESDWLLQLQANHPGVKFRGQAIKLRLANGAFYKPDLMAWLNCRVICWELKGGKKMKGHAKGMLTIKVAATLWEEICFILVWRENGMWMQQEILP